MSKEDPTQASVSADLITALLWAVANLLFMRYLGQWLMVTGACGICLALAIWITALARKTRLRAILANLLLVLTLANFNAWAFSHLGNLFYFLGLFFFVLFGLILGATVFRLLSAFRPIRRPTLICIGWLFILVTWGGGLVLEASYLPEDVYDATIKTFKRGLPPGLKPADFKRDVLEQTTAYLRENYGSNLTISYVLWELAGGSMDLTVRGRERSLAYERPQRRKGFALRVLASLALVAYGMFSQIGVLTKTREQLQAEKDAATDEEDTPDPKPMTRDTTATVS